jgi:hypothetical protein
MNVSVVIQHELYSVGGMAMENIYPYTTYETNCSTESTSTSGTSYKAAARNLEISMHANGSET